MPMSAQKRLIVDFQCEIPQSNELPTQADFERWLTSAYQHSGSLNQNVEVCLRIVGPEEMAELNQNYRNKTGTTNVLSFPADDSLPAEILESLEERPLGDIVICADVIMAEAEKFEKPLNQRWAHISIHGMLHLLGFDHITEPDAQQMEALEAEIMQKLGFDESLYG